MIGGDPVVKRKAKKLQRCDVERPCLKYLARYWVDKLRLQHCTIYVRYGDHDQTGQHQAGENVLFSVDFLYRITILDPMLCNEESLPDVNVEETLVHELLHIPVDLFFSEGSHGRDFTRAEYVALEQHMNTVSRALVTIERERRKLLGTIVPAARKNGA